MPDFIFGILKQRMQGMVRSAVIFLGGLLVAKGLFTKDQWAAFSPYVEQILGAIAALGMAAWSYHSNGAKVIVATADKMIQKGQVDPTKTVSWGNHDFTVEN